MCKIFLWSATGGWCPRIRPPSEPAMRRWPHPVDGTEPMQCPDPSLQYIRCALSYQNQLLAEIRSLLEQMAASAPEK